MDTDILKAIAEGLRQEGMHTYFVTHPKRCLIRYGPVPYAIYCSNDYFILHNPNDTTTQLPVDLADPDCFTKLKDYIITNHSKVRRKRHQEWGHWD